jgi:hypothetical protein
MNYMYKIYLISFVLTLFLFFYNNKEHFTDVFTLPGKYDVNFIYYYSLKSSESLKLKEQILKLKDNINNTTINCFKLKIFIIEVEQYPLIQKKYNIVKSPTMHLMFQNKNEVFYEEFNESPTFINLTNAINNIYTKKLQYATYKLLVSKNDKVFNDILRNS